MKILQINKFYAPTIGGIETWVQQIAEGLNDRTDMRVLVCQEKGDAVDEVHNDVYLTRAKSYGTLLSMPISLDFFLKFQKMSSEADIIQMHFPFPLADLALWIFKPKAKIVVWWHSDIIRQKFFGKLLSPFIHCTLKQAKLIIVATQGYMDSSVYLPLYKDKCRIIPLGLNFDEYPIPEEKHYLSKKLNTQTNKKLLFVGRLVYYKGIHILLKAMEQVSGAELFIIGDGILQEDVENVVGKKIHWLSSLPREDLIATFYDCDVFVFPSVANSEAFGIVQLEAMYYGKPVINTNLPTGVPYVSIGGETGLTVEAGNAEALTEAITKLINNDVLRKEYGENAARRVREKFDCNTILKRLNEEYEAL